MNIVPPDPKHEQMHLEHYGYEMAKCSRCDVNDPLYLVRLDDGTRMVIHEKDLKKGDGDGGDESVECG